MLQNRWRCVMAVTRNTGYLLGQRVVTGVAAERAFSAQRLARVNEAFDAEVGVSGSP